MDDGSRDEAQARRAEALVLEGSVSDFALAMEEHCPSERVARLALIKLILIISLRLAAVAVVLVVYAW